MVESAVGGAAADRRNADRIECLLYGGNPDLYRDIAETFSDTGTAQTCIDEHAGLEATFTDWFGAALVDENESQGASVSYAYETPEGARSRLKAVEDYMAQNQMLEDLAEDIAQFIDLPEDVSIVAKSCGAGQAEFKYNDQTREITLCYEAVEWFMKRAALGPDEVPADDDASATAAGDDDFGSGGARVKKKPVKR